MKKILTLLALVSSSICFASSNGNLPVNNATESVALAPVAPIADTALVISDRGVLKREFFEEGWGLRSVYDARALPPQLKLLAIAVNTVGDPVKVKWETLDGETGSSGFEWCSEKYQGLYYSDFRFSVFSFDKCGGLVNLDDTRIARGETWKIEELSIVYELDHELFKGHFRGVSINADIGQDLELSVDRIITNGIDDLRIKKVNNGKLCINHIKMSGSGDPHLWLFDVQPPTKGAFCDFGELSTSCYCSAAESVGDFIDSCLESIAKNPPVIITTKSAKFAASTSVAQNIGLATLLERGGNLCYVVKAHNLPPYVKRFSITVNAVGDPVEVKWETIDGETGSFSFDEHFGNYRKDYGEGLGLPVTSSSEQGSRLYLDGKMTRKIDELFINCESTRERTGGEPIGVVIPVNIKGNCELLIDKIIAKDLDYLEIDTYDNAKVRINHIEMRGGNAPHLSLGGKFVYKGRILAKDNTVIYKGHTLSNGLYNVAPNGELNPFYVCSAKENAAQFYDAIK